MHKSMGPVELHPKILRELADEAIKPLSIIFESHGSPVKFPVTGKGETKSTFFRKGKKKEMRSCRPVSLTFVPSNVMEHSFLEAILRHMENKEVIGDI